jgi:hypothetical protein
MAWRGQTDINLQNISLKEQNKYTAIAGKQLVQYQPTDRLMFGAFYSTDILNFTASLLEKNIRSTTYGYLTHIMFDGKNGIYSQGDLSNLSDGNQKWQFFGSLYHLFNTSPLLKGGINFSALHFKDNTITTYFSPDKYLSTELFVDYKTQIPGVNGLTLATQAAAGFQQIEATGWDPSMRLQAEINYSWKRFQSSLRYQTSNVAAGTGTGYKFNWFTARLTWSW